MIYAHWSGLSAARVLAARELLSDYRQSRMSVVWPVLHPLLYTVLFVILRPVLGGGHIVASPWAFACFVFMGFSLYQGWFDSLRGQMDALRRNRALVSRGELGSGTLFAATLMVNLAYFAPRLIASLIASLILVRADASAALMLLLFGTAVVLNGAVIGALLQPFATLSADFGKAVQSVSLGIMVSGAVFIILPAKLPPVIAVALCLNPMGALLNAARSPFFGEPLISATASLVWLGITCAIAVVIPFMGRRILPIVIERLGN